MSLVCQLCAGPEPFRIPAPMDPIGAALMAAHLAEHDRAEGQALAPALSEVRRNQIRAMSEQDLLILITSCDDRVDLLHDRIDQLEAQLRSRGIEPA